MLQNSAAKTLWIGPVLIYASTLDYVLPNCTRGNLNSNDKPLRSFAKELAKIIEERAPIPTGCSQPPPPPLPPPSPSRTATTTGGGGGGNGASITLGPLVLTASSAPAEREVGMWGVVAGLLAAAVGLGVVGGL